jgi:hypothetical protein
MPFGEGDPPDEPPANGTGGVVTDKLIGSDGDAYYQVRAKDETDW